MSVWFRTFSSSVVQHALWGFPTRLSEQASVHARLRHRMTRESFFCHVFQVCTLKYLWGWDCTLRTFWGPRFVNAQNKYKECLWKLVLHTFVCIPRSCLLQTIFNNAVLSSRQIWRHILIFFFIVFEFLKESDKLEWLCSSLARIGWGELREPLPKIPLPEGNRSPTGVLGCPWAKPGVWSTYIAEVEAQKHKFIWRNVRCNLPGPCGQFSGANVCKIAP